MIFTLLLFIITKVESKVEILDFCGALECSDSVAICGIREEGDGYRLRQFDNECDLLKYGCSVSNKLAYGAVSMYYCNRTFEGSAQLSDEKPEHPCADFDCSYPGDAKNVCGIRKDGEGFRIRLFKNKCDLRKHNCENDVTFTESEIHICDGMTEDDHSKPEARRHIPYEFENNVILVNSRHINFNNYNESIENFFTATHVFDLPVREIKEGNPEMNETTRRRLINIFGPIKVYKPWITIPSPEKVKKLSEDDDYKPTLSSCYHKCPKECPDTYAPVCGSPGSFSREPKITFKNHCFMDQAQCKMWREDKSDTAQSSYYVEFSFMFCLGDEMNGLYRFLPLVKTLQHMGRLKKKGIFRYKINNMRFFNNFLSREPNIQG